MFISYLNAWKCFNGCAFFVCFSYGPVQSVKQLGGATSDGSESNTGNTSSSSGNNNDNSGNCYTVAFVDICSATKARKVEHRIDDHPLETRYYEPSVTSLSSGHYTTSSSTSSGVGTSSSSSSQQGGGGGGGSSSGGGNNSGSVSHYPSGPPLQTHPSQGSVQSPLGARSPRFG